MSFRVLVSSCMVLGMLPAQAIAGAALTDADLRGIVDQRLSGDRTGACLAVAVVERDSVARAYTCADPKHASRIDADTAFEIGSVSKTMTAVLLADLIGQGKASLDDPLADYLPEGTKVPDFQGKPILLRHVVTHTSGLPRLPAGMNPIDPRDPYAGLTTEMLLAALANTTLAGAPGTRREYSNFAAMLLSWAVARRAGVDLETLLDRRLFSPLGMTGAYVNRKPEGVRAATGHLSTGQQTPPWNFSTDLAGVGGVRATLDDMVRYVQVQFGQGRAPIAEAIERSQQPIPTKADPPGQPAMAMYWMLAPLAGRTLHVHEGGTGGFTSFVSFDRQRQRGVVVLSDTAMHSLGGLSSLGMHLADRSIPLGKPRKPAKAADALLDALVGEYVLQGGMTATLARDGDSLTIHTAGQPVYRMGYDTVGDFYPLTFDALLRPRKKADGSMSFTWHQSGAVVAATRKGATTQTPELAQEQLDDYAGEYTLKPGFALSVRVRNERLHAQATGQGEFPLTESGQDRFEASEFGIEIVFMRNDAGEVASLELHQGGQVLRGGRGAP